MSGTETRRGLADKFRRPITVESIDDVRAAGWIHGDQRTQRHHVVVRCADVEAVDSVWIPAILRLRLHDHAPGAAEPVEIVDVKATEKSLKPVVHIRDGNTERLCLIVIEVDAVTRHGHPKNIRDLAQRRLCLCSSDKALSGVCKFADVPTRAVFDHKLETARGSQTQNRR